MRRLAFILFLLVAPLLGQPAAAQDVASLVADSVQAQGQNVLVASGNVVVLYKNNRLSASRVTYDQTANKLSIEGPITLIDADNRATVLASSAELSSDLLNGVMHSARMVLEDKLQVAADEIDRVGGRYTQMKQTVTSSCLVCAAHPVPLWEIRAKRIIHDRQEQQLYFDQATFRFDGVPVFYLPRVRLPDPSVKRASGFLVPVVTGSSTFGTGVKVPYFFVLGPTRDLTFEPFIATKNAETLGFRYREAFNTGALEVKGAYSRDELRPGQSRGYVFANGSFVLPRQFRLNLQLQTVSDPDYFLNYGLTQVDRLKSGIELTRTRRDEYIDGQLLHFHSIRAGDDNATLPTDVGSFTWARRFQPAVIGGEASLQFDTHALYRASSTDVTGRDLARAGILFDWRRNWTIGPGIVVSGIGSLQSDLYSIAQDSTYPSTILRTVPTVGVELRWPWVKAEANGASQVVEPIVQLLWSPTHVARVPNEDSQLAEFDEGNLWDTSHFAGLDGVELGARANVGLSWTRYDPNGWSLGVVGGRIYRQATVSQFDPASGLGAAESDWLVALQAKWQRFDLINRTVFGNGKGIAKNELRLGWTGPKFAVATSYIWMVADPTAYLPLTTLPTREWTLDASYPIKNNWSGKVAWRYDFVAHRADGTGVKLAWQNECMTVDLSLSRMYASSTSAGATTTFGFSVGLIGFGGGTDVSASPGTCRR